MNVWTLAGTLVATLALAKAAAQGWRTTLGRRRYLRSRLQVIAPGVRAAYVDALLGEPTWQRHKTCTRIASVEVQSASSEDRRVDITESTWPLGRLGYLVTWSQDEVVVAYALTTTTWWFRPHVRVGQSSIRLGHTPLATLKQPGQHRAWLGARRFAYEETHYVGNPGGYLEWRVGVNDLGYRARPYIGDLDGTGCLPAGPLAAYRKEALINTIFVSQASYEELLDGAFFEVAFGVDRDLVRLTQPEFRVIDSRLNRMWVHIRTWRSRRRCARAEKESQATR